MLIPLTRKTFEQIIPIVATGAQYAHYWGKWSDLLRRLLISVVGMFAIILLKIILFQQGFDGILLICGITIGLYWLWGPIFSASKQNIECRRYGYCGFWRGKVLDIYITEELVGTEETVNNRGDLVIVENRERCLNLEVGDELGFLTSLRVPLKRNHRAIDVGDMAELLVFSNRADLGRISKTSDIYIPDHNLWVSDYPYVQRDAFIDVSRRINLRLDTDYAYSPEPEPPKRSKRSPKTGVNQRGSLTPRNQDDWRDYPGDTYRNDRDLDSEPTRRRSSRRRSNRDR
ncbi:MAG: phosphate ABC transporter permease [Leptolyngbyaceae cyanobacterium bins.349]|nr:phosphate ABC transporter permease [Leptolyngbyaceae cyanobacterium bins.349]